VNASGGFTVGDVTTNSLDWDPSGITGHKMYTPLNFSGTIRPSTGAFVAGHIVSTDANGLYVDGGAPGTGTWTDASTNTGTNKTLVATEAGGTNTLTTGLVAAFDGGGLTSDGSACSDASIVTLNTTGPRQAVMICSTAATAQFDAMIPGLKGALAGFTIQLTVNDVDSSAQHFAGTFKAQCRASGTAPSSTWGSTQAVNITMTTAETNYTGTTGAITPNGTCSAGASLYIRFNADGNMTDDGDARIIGILVKQSS
jgi:hypothetical protein